MKSVLIFLTFAFAVRGEMTVQEFITDLSAKLSNVGVSCAEKLEISEAAMAELTQKKFPTEHDGKCVIHCVHSHFGFMDDKGNFNKEKILSFMAPLKTADAEIYKKFLEVEDICSVTKHDDPCETAAAGMECTLTEMKKRGVTADFFEF